MKLDAVYTKKVFRPLEPGKVKLAEGERVRLEVSRHRSTRQHNFLFVALAKAYDTWPEDHPFQPADVDQLRYWLEIRAGWGDTVEFVDPRSLISFMNQHWKYNMWAVVEDDKYFVNIAKSIAYGKMNPGDFKKLVDSIDVVLMREVGFGLMELKESVLEDAN